jgi:hypothetical protein
VRAPSQRRALGALFLVLAVGFAVVAVAALRADRWIIAFAAAAMAAWIGSLALAGLGLRRRRR